MCVIVTRLIRKINDFPRNPDKTNAFRCQPQIPIGMMIVICRLLLMWRAVDDCKRHSANTPLSPHNKPYLGKSRIKRRLIKEIQIHWWI